MSKRIYDMGEGIYEYLRGYRKKGTKYYTLIDKVYDTRNLYNAWEKVKENKGGCGVDKVTIGQFEENLEQNITEIQRLLQQQRYQPQEIKRIYIPKPDGKQRPLGIPTIRDRVIQQALLNVLTPVFEPIFLECSFGFRPERSAHQAIKQVEDYKNEGYVWVVDADIKSYFDTIDHDLLMQFISEEISDTKILKLIRDFLNAKILEGKKLTNAVTGTPQGGVISPLLANIYLHKFDVEMTNKGYKLVRYADDWLIMCKTKENANNALMDAKTILGKLILEIHPQKTRIAHLSEGIEFLGFKIYEQYKVPRDRGIKNYKDKIRKISRRQQPIKTKDLCKRLNLTIVGWGKYFKIGNVKMLFKQLDGWTRMRVRAFIEKKKTRNSNWRITNDSLKEMGLISLCSLLN